MFRKTFRKLWAAIWGPLPVPIGQGHRPTTPKPGGGTDQVEGLRDALRKIREIAYQAPQLPPDEEALQYMNICTEALGDGEEFQRTTRPQPQAVPQEGS